MLRRPAKLVVVAVTAAWVGSVDAQVQTFTPADFRLTLQRTDALILAHERGWNFIPGEVVVKFRAGVNASGRQRALNALRRPQDANGLQFLGDLAIVRDPFEPNAHILAQQLSEQPEVEYAEPNYVYKPPGQPSGASEPISRGASLRLTPNDPDYTARQWNFDLLNLRNAWEISPGGDPNLVVAVIDSGLNTVEATRAVPLWDGTAIRTFNIPFGVHPDFDVSRIVNPRDFVFLAEGTPAIDMTGHGTHVASTIAQTTNNGVGLAGIAYRARIMPLKVCVGYWEVQMVRSASGITGFAPFGSGGCASAEMANAMRYAADNGARVINMSIGGSSPSIAVRDAIAYAVGRGVFVAVSAGNEFEDGNPTRYPASFAPTIDGMVSVAATSRTLTRAFYSSTGTWVELAAPGGDSRLNGSSGAIWQTTLRPADVSGQLLVPRFDRFENTAFQGTSMASPHVAGTAALVMSRLPSFTPKQVEMLLRQTARDMGAAGKDDSFGYGLVQPRAALFGSGIRR